jgi:hypothetical protein
MDGLGRHFNERTIQSYIKDTIIIIYIYKVAESLCLIWTELIG